MHERGECQKRHSMLRWKHRSKWPPSDGRADQSWPAAPEATAAIAVREALSSETAAAAAVVDWQRSSLPLSMVGT